MHLIGLFNMKTNTRGIMYKVFFQRISTTSTNKPRSIKTTKTASIIINERGVTVTKQQQE